KLASPNAGEMHIACSWDNSPWIVTSVHIRRPRRRIAKTRMYRSRHRAADIFGLRTWREGELRRVDASSGAACSELAIEAARREKPGKLVLDRRADARPLRGGYGQPPQHQAPAIPLDAPATLHGAG